jgi:Amt family ammonium transporter
LSDKNKIMIRKIVLSVLLIVLLVVTFFSNLFSISNTQNLPEVKFDSGDTAWMIVATALVLLMTPGLGFFMADWWVKKM